jgi:GT2 family glycosyltransferase
MEQKQSKEPLISVVIPNLNGMTYLPDCLSSLHEQTFDQFEVIIVDNGSTDNSLEFIRKNFPRTVIIENTDNLGFAKANNQGIAAAKGKYIAALNNDTKVDRDWLRNLFTAAESSGESVGMWAPKILSLENPDQIDSVGGLLLFPDGIARGRGRLETDKGQYDGIRDILMPSACSALYSKSMLDEIGYFDEDFFAYCEDTDLALRARRAGWTAASVPDAVIYHHYSGTGGKYSGVKAFLVERNHLWVAWKNFPSGWVCLLPYYVLLRYLYQLYGAFSGKGSAARFKESNSITDIVITIFKAYISAFSGLPAIIRKRAALKNRISDKTLKEPMQRDRITARDLALLD